MGAWCILLIESVSTMVFWWILSSMLHFCFCFDYLHVCFALLSISALHAPSKMYVQDGVAKKMMWAFCWMYVLSLQGTIPLESTHPNRQTHFESFNQRCTICLGILTIKFFLKVSDYSLSESEGQCTAGGAVRNLQDVFAHRAASRRQ